MEVKRDQNLNSELVRLITEVVPDSFIQFFPNLDGVEIIIVDRSNSSKMTRLNPPLNKLLTLPDEDIKEMIRKAVQR